MEVSYQTNNNINYQSSNSLKKTSINTAKKLSHKTDVIKKDKGIYDLPFNSIYKASSGNKTFFHQIRFKGYQDFPQDKDPARKEAYVLTGQNINDIKFNYDPFLYNHNYKSSNGEHWANAHPSELLRRSAIDDIATTLSLTNQTNIPSNIKTPVKYYEKDWGHDSVFISTVPRALGTVSGNKQNDGMLGMIKILPSIPTASNGRKTCVLVGGLYPPFFGDGYIDQGNEESSLYTTDLDNAIYHPKVSESLVSHDLKRGYTSVTPDEQVKAFNDLAHLRGLTTGIILPLNEGQLKINGQGFNWDNGDHVETFINRCCNAVEMGFDAIHFDSAKHCGGYDQGNAAGVGRCPSDDTMRYISKEIRQRTQGVREGSPVCLVGEMCDENRAKSLWLNVGTAEGKQISNDNDNGWKSYDERLNTLKDSLDRNKNHGPVFMTMHDLYPLNPQTNVHDLFLHSRSFSAYGDPISHWNNMFAKGDAANNYRVAVQDAFGHC